MNRFLWILMILLLVATAVGASWMFNQGPFVRVPPQAQADDKTPPPPTVIALGLIDGEKPVARPAPLVQGRVVEIITEGTEVKKGAAILKLDAGMYEASEKEAKAALDDAQEKFKQAQDLPEQFRLKQLQQQQAIAGAEADRKSTRLERDDKLNQAKKSGITINDTLMTALEERLKQLDAKVLAETAKLDEIKLFKPQSEIARAQADVHAKEAQLARAQWALRQCTLEAPSDGLVLRVSVNPGEVLAAGMPGQAPPVQFLPKGPKIVRAEILQEWANLVRVGQDVDIEDDTYHGPTWKGRVKSVSNWYAPKRERIIEPFMLNDVRTLECIVEVLDESAPLRIGQRVRVKIKSK